MDSADTGRVHSYSRDEMMTIRDVSEGSRRRPSELPVQFNNEEGLFSPDAWIEHCWIREGVADRIGAETGKRKPLLGELPGGGDHQQSAQSSTRKGFFDDVVGASAHSKLRSHKYSANGMDFRPSFQKTSTTPGQSPDVYRPWMRNMDYTSVGTHRHTERHESVPEWVDNGPESTTDVIELRGFDDGKETNARSHRREQKKLPTATIPLTMPQTDEEFAALLGLTFDDLKLNASTKTSSSESSVPAQSRFSKFFATNNTQSSTQPSSDDDGGVGGKGAEAAPNGAEKTVTPGAHSLLQKLFGGKLGDVRTEDGSKINSGVSPLRKGVMSAEELERQLMMEAQLKTEDLSSSSGAAEAKQAQVVSSCESETAESASIPAGADDESSTVEDVEASPPHAPIPSSHLPAVHPQLLNPVALEAFLQQYFPAQDRLLRMHSVTPFDLYQRRLTFIHIMSRQWPMGVPGGGVPPQAFPPFATPPLPPNPLPNPAAPPDNSIVDHAPQQSTDYYSGRDVGGEKAGAPPMLQKLLSQSGSRSESHAGSPLPTSATKAPVSGKKMMMSVEELEKSFLESESSTTRTPIETQQRTPSVCSQHSHLPIPTPHTLAQMGPPLMAGWFPPPLRMPLFPTHPNAPAIPAHAQMHAYHHFLMAQQAQLFQQRQQAAMANASTTGSSAPSPPPQLSPASHLPPAPPVHIMSPHAQFGAPGLNNRTTPSQTSSKRTTPTGHSSADESAIRRNIKADGMTKPAPTMSSAAFMPTSVMRKQASRKQSDGPKTEVCGEVAHPAMAGMNPK